MTLDTCTLTAHSGTSRNALHYRACAPLRAIRLLYDTLVFRAHGDDTVIMARQQ